ncbi:hypothetical protein CHUAL_010044 [Chamberlinius hualienensis]
MIYKLSGERFESLVSVILRVPGVFVIDYWWRYESSKSWPDSVEWADLAGVFLTNLVLLQGLMLLLLSLENLVTLYMHYIGASLLVVTHLFSAHYVSVEQQGSTGASSASAAIIGASDDPHFLPRQIAALIIHIAIATTVAFLLDLHHQAHRMMLAAYTLPVVARLSSFPISEIHIIHNFVSAFMIMLVLYYIIKHIPTVAYSLKYVATGLMNALEIYGWLGVSIAVWNSLFIPIHLFLFWVVQMVSHAYYYSYQSRISDQNHEWYLIFLTCTSEVCGSPISLVSTSVAVSYISYYLLTATKFFLQGYNAFVSDNLVHSGWTEGLTLILLSLQTGMVDLKMPHRAAVMTIVLFIVVSSLIQSMFEITEPFLLALSASHNKSVIKHARTLVLCCFLFVFPLYMTAMLCQVFQIDFWMLVVISSCIMTSVQVLGLVSIYSLFMYDAWRKEPWEALDDVVYYTRSGTRVLEFLVAVFVVGAGLRESLMGSWSWINSSVLIIHCYFNVWQRLQSGWKSFLLRRDAVIKIESMPVAGEKELDEYGDVCAICYCEMKSARVTICKHIYHATCLRKWLYVQDKCPLCHANITPTSQNEANVRHDSEQTVDLGNENRQ